MLWRTLASLAVTTALCACGSSPCDYAHASCDPGHVCVRTDASKTECVLTDELDQPLRAPFVDGHAFGCSQGPRSALGRTHSFRSDVFAVDLPSRGPEAGVVVAPLDGEAFVFDGCADPAERADAADARNDSRCGAGYGNHVKIWDGQTMVLLAHLSRVTIKDGIVRAGQPVGVEGVSGAAGHRHVHMSVTRPAKPELGEVRKILTTPGWVGRIPMRFRLTVRDAAEAAVKVRGVDDLQCSDDAAARAAYWPERGLAASAPASRQAPSDSCGTRSARSPSWRDRSRREASVRCTSASSARCFS